MAEKRQPIQSSTTYNVPPPTKPTTTIEENYQSRTQFEHILLFPELYIGSDEKHKQMLWVWQDDQMVRKSISFVPGLYKIFDEIIVNAADSKQRDPKMDSVKVTIDVKENLISVYNNGDGIPVEIDQEEGVYVPEILFGRLLTRSKYDDDFFKKTTGGRFGFGAKLANMFSTEFTLETADGNRRYKQVFLNNMQKISMPTITDCNSGENWTLVSFKPDLSKFGMECLDADVVALMKKRVVDLAGCFGKSVKVELDGKRVPVNSFEEYVKLYLQSSQEQPRIYEKVNERWEICVTMADGHFEQVSFVNTLATIKGGTHVNYITNQIANHIVAVVNKQNKHANLKAHNVKKYLWVFVNSVIDNPSFESQMKETLTINQSSFGSTCELTPEFLTKVEKSGILKKVLSREQFEQHNDFEKTDGNKRGKLDIPEFEEANFADTTQSDKCTLILTKGDLAKTSAMSGLSAVGQDYYGLYPLKSILPNTRGASPERWLENVEIQNIKKLLGLQHGMEYTSTISLRYAHLMIMADQDHEGLHIKGALMNFFYAFWPSLLKVPEFVLDLVTPSHQITTLNPVSVLNFYTLTEYQEWILEHQETKFKSMPHNKVRERAEYFRYRRKKDCVWVDDEDGDAIELACNKKVVFRDSWCWALKASHIRQTLITDCDHQSIPSMVDGLKSGQRKILFCAFKKPIFPEVNVAHLSDYVSQHCSYLRGEACHVPTIIGMAQDFVGSNNINILYPIGHFGTRYMGGKDHAKVPYLYTTLTHITRHLFHKADEDLLNYMNEGGKSVEPTWYLPVIPMILVNGSEGTGARFSTFVPSYNPRDIIANVRRLLNGEAMVRMDPWYRGFKGRIQRSSSKDIGYISTGIFEERDDGISLSITELPVRRWTQEYKEFLDAASLSGKDKESFIEEYNAHNDDTTVHFEVIMTADQMNIAKQEGILKKFKLTTSFNTSNMYLFDANGCIKKYATPEQILEDFFRLRMCYYEKRKNALLCELQNELLTLENQLRFIEEVVDGNFVFNGKKADLFAELDCRGYAKLPKKDVLEASIAGAADRGYAKLPKKDVLEASIAGAADHAVRSKDYDYLLLMTYKTFADGKEYQKKIVLKKAEIEDLRCTPSRTLWLRDLDALEKQLDEQDAEDEAKRRKLQEKKAPAKSKGKTSSRDEEEEIPAAAPAAAKGRWRKAVAQKKAPAKSKGKTSSRDEEEEIPAAAPAAAKGRRRIAAAQKKAPAKSKGKTSSRDGEEEEIPAAAPAAAKGRRKAAAQKKALAKSKGKTSLRGEEEEIPSVVELMVSQNLNNVQEEVSDDDIAELEDRLAMHKIESSPDQSEVPKKKQCCYWGKEKSVHYFG